MLSQHPEGKKKAYNHNTLALRVEIVGMADPEVDIDKISPGQIGRLEFVEATDDVPAHIRIVLVSI